MRQSTKAEIARQPDLEHLSGYLWKREGARLAYLAQRVPKGQVIVELGSNQGKSACFLARGSSRGNHVPVHCVDLWDLGGQWEHTHLRTGAPLRFEHPDTLRTFLEQTAPFSDLIVEHKAPSTAVGQLWDGPPVGLLFVDGDHSYPGVRGDIEAWERHVAPGGWVCFHDYNKGRKEAKDYPGITCAVDEWLARTKVRDAVRTQKLLTVQL